MIFPMKGGFSLIEVVIAFSIATLGIAVSYHTIGLISERLKNFNTQKQLKEISLVQEIYLTELKRKKRKASSLSKEFNKGNLSFINCYTAILLKINYSVCEYLKIHPVSKKPMKTNVYYISQVDLLFTR